MDSGPSSEAAGWAVIQNCTVVNNLGVDPLDVFSSVIRGRVLVIHSIRACAATPESG